jgi:hypothetical protein
MAGWSALYVTRLRRPPMHSPELSPGSRPFTAGLSFRLSKQWISRVHRCGYAILCQQKTKLLSAWCTSPQASVHVREPVENPNALRALRLFSIELPFG